MSCKNFKSWIEDVKLDIKTNNIKIKGWHQTNMYNFRIWWNKHFSCGKKTNFSPVRQNSPRHMTVKAYSIK